MGEYATRKSDQAHIKIGTCESMYYLRFDDIHLIEYDHNLLEPGCSFRLPFPDEDDLPPGAGSYEEYERAVGLMPYTDQDTGKEMEFDDPWTRKWPGLIQAHHKTSGILVNFPCYHGILPEGNGKSYKEGGIAFHWNGKTPTWALVRVKLTETGLLPLITCRHCGQLFRTSWAAVLLHVADERLRHRLMEYATWLPSHPLPQTRSI